MEGGLCRACLGAALLSLGAGCGPTLSRIAPPVSLASSGQPANDCERGEWYELVPTRASDSDSDSYTDGSWVYTNSVTRENAGYAVYRLGASEPEALRELLPRLGTPALTDLHLGRLNTIERRRRAALRLIGVGSTLTVAGLGGVFAFTRQAGEPPFLAFLGALAAGAVVALVAVLINPRANDRTYARIRRYLLLEGEDDLEQATAGVDRLNSARRAACGGAPAPANP